MRYQATIQSIFVLERTICAIATITLNPIPTREMTRLWCYWEIIIG